ncbi:DUF4328 domain-containing protein [Kribbella sp. NPDC051952]|uniref:DUF4328 domain-containing protein n=1 Tax=Kribbella sp. NPDC051952 TaxID=3154851 RepID=UPI003432B06A
MSHPQQAVLSAVEDHEEWQPHAAEEFQQVGTVGKIAIGLLGASTITHLLSTWSDWNTYSVVHRYLGGMPNVDDADLNRADAIAKVTAVPNVIISVAAAVVFVIWLWRARVNSEVFCQADHRRGHGWVLASWFCPGPNLWYPKQIVDDVWLASDPKTPVYADDLRRFRTPSLTSVWWVAWVGALAFDVVVRRFLMWMEATVGSLRGIALAGTASLVLTVVSAIAATMVIRKINHMQTTREWLPWWDQREPKLAVVPTYANDDTDEQPAISEPIAASVPAPTRRLERQPEYQMAGGVQAPPANPFAPAAPQGFPGDGAAAGGFPPAPPAPPVPAAPAAFTGESPVEEPPKWSPFAPVVSNWQDDNGGPATEQFSPVESWQNEKPAEETAYEAPKTSWNEYLGDKNDDVLSTNTSSRWLDEAAPLTVVPPDPYSYQPQQPEPEPTWAASYSEPYSYETPDYLTSTSTPEVETAPEPEPAPVARAGRRAARVAVDSPSAIQSAIPSNSGEEYGASEYSAPADHSVYSPSEHTVYGQSDHTPASSGYYEPAPALGQQDDYLTPSKPLPTVPSYGPEPSYQPESYSSEYSTPSYDESSYQPTSYEAPSDYQTSYGSEYTSTSYEPTEYSGSSYSSDYSSPSPSGYESTSYDSYNNSQYGGGESYETYSPNYAADSYYTPADQPTQQPTGQPEEQQPAEYQQEQYSYEEPAPEQPTTPRTHPRRRWV